ncbi:MAG: hypothetical protein Q7S40_33485, partial [Opitutaceae bacterium]|nr:hypothetical protein [Opitutaceae bacterium]
RSLRSLRLNPSPFGCGRLEKPLDKLEAFQSGNRFGREPAEGLRRPGSSVTHALVRLALK